MFLLKDSITNPEDALDPDKSRTAIQLADNSSVWGTLFVGAQKRGIPDWVGMLNQFLVEPVVDVYSASIAAVLIVWHEERYFALTFGSGRFLLDPRACVRDFGLKVTLNRVDPAKLRSMDSKVYDDLVVSTRKQLSRSGAVANFELDVGRALLRGVTGDANDGEIFKRLTGASALRFTTELSFSQLDDILEEVVAAYEDTTYQANFGWIDNVREVNEERAEELDGLLETALLQPDAGGAYLAPADVVDWTEIDAFNYTGGSSGVEYQDLSLPAYVAIHIGKGQPPDIAALKRHRVKVRRDGQPQWRDEWAVYECIVWETDLNGRKYVLFDGRWFAVDQQYAASVLGYVASISVDPSGLPDGTVGEWEEVYNAAVETADPATYALLDRQLFTPTGGGSQIEFCDLLSSGCELVHVKKRSGSATLSHLFAQGSVAADLFLQDQGLRAAVRQNLTTAGKTGHAALIPPDRPVPNDFEVVYAVLVKPGRRAWPPPLPFFSAVNLMHHATRIQNLGFRVSIRHVRLN
ncbi:TIGR04141 family sporadically distributed protein [Haloferula rosea]|uniref:TIGR04141 family sporadically distributed protein n=2 Tax=Haloferula rosea TaxID=490093 RepID=A0A934VBG5_9BACT|nr:TIGR04141 family sporadically distributed protein [Haloferula rosea]